LPIRPSNHIATTGMNFAAIACAGGLGGGAKECCVDWREGLRKLVDKVFFFWRKSCRLLGGGACSA